jgi:hypothetical protein
VLPESIKIGGGEGPSVVGSMLTVLLTFSSLLGVLGGPLGHSLGVTASLSFGLGFGLVIKMALYLGGLVIRIRPPMTLVSVAFLLWPVAGCLHVALVWLQMPCDQQYVPHWAGVGSVGGWMAPFRMPVLAVSVPFMVMSRLRRNLSAFLKWVTKFSTVWSAASFSSQSDVAFLSYLSTVQHVVHVQYMYLCRTNANGCNTQ